MPDVRVHSTVALSVFNLWCDPGAFCGTREFMADFFFSLESLVVTLTFRSSFLLIMINTPVQWQPPCVCVPCAFLYVGPMCS